MSSSRSRWATSSWRPATICSTRGVVTQYGYGRLANVFTSLEFERLTNAAGPTNGDIVLRDGVTTPKTVGILHCVGSRDRNFNNYCSVICCMQSLKFAHLVHERTGATVYNFYIDMRTAYKEYDEFYQRVLEEGTLFVRGKVAEVTDAARLPGEEGKLIIQVEDTLAGKQRRIPVDMVVLSAAMVPRHDSQGYRQIVRHLLQRKRLVYREAPQTRPGRDDDRRHFHRRLRPGTEGYPLVRVSGRGGLGTGAGAHPAEGNFARNRCAPAWTRTRCSGCRICNNLCPFNAITFIEERKVTEINPALCQGCGTCVAACPAGAISGTVFSNEQIFAQIEGLMMVNLKPSQPSEVG